MRVIVKVTNVGIKKIQKYLPIDEMDEGRYPNKKYFWGVVFTVEPEWATKYYKAVVKKRTTY